MKTQAEKKHESMEKGLDQKEKIVCVHEKMPWVVWGHKAEECETALATGDYVCVGIDPEYC